MLELKHQIKIILILQVSFKIVSISYIKVSKPNEHKDTIM